jgi:hypothetical protein
MSVAAAQSAVPHAYTVIVRNRARLRPMRSATQPKSTPPIAQPTSSIDVRMPVQKTVASRASVLPGMSPSNTGTAFGATKLKSRASKTSKPHPNQTAASTSQ